MKCPACQHPLRRFKAGTVTLDGCDGGCGGIWFDHRELAKVNREYPNPDAQVAELSRNPAVRTHDDDIRKCSKCGVTLEKKLYSLGSGVIMDVCPKCNGIWLDGGELEKIRESIHPRPHSPRAVNREPVKIAVDFGVVQQVQILQNRQSV
jgi:uncharacterized protein